MKKDRFDAWVQAYRRAWESNDAAEIGALFSEKASYYPKPHMDPWSGRDEIVRNWIEFRDEPGQTTFDYEVIAVDGDLGIVRGTTDYLATKLRYNNLWEVRLDSDDACNSFTEWWIEIP